MIKPVKALKHVKPKLSDGEMGMWNFLHGTGAGCASIVAWEAIRTALTGPVLLVAYSGVTIGIMHLVHRHRVSLMDKKNNGNSNENQD